MHALIVAAGYGSRLRTISPSKPLTGIAGVPLIDRVIGAAAAGGATGFTVVTGHEAALLEAHLERLAQRLRLPLDWVTTDDWSRPNGHSVLTGADHMGPQRHLLLMADHLFNPTLVASVIDAPAVPLALAVDRRLGNPLVDLTDVTRVRTVDDRIVAIGKHLSVYDAFDCGVFTVDGRFHDALRADIARGGEGSISAGVAALAAGGGALAVDVGDAWWLDVDDPAALAHAEAAFGTSTAA